MSTSLKQYCQKMLKGMVRKLSLIQLFLQSIILTLVLVLAAEANVFKDFDLSQLGGSAPEVELLPDEQAFQVIATDVREGQLNIQWLSAPEYYLYRKNFKIVSKTPGVTIGDMVLPAGEIEADPLFGDVEVYFDQVLVKAPIQLTDPTVKEVLLTLHAQGCNKPVGICYPPQQRDVIVLLDATDATDATLPSAASAASTQEKPAVQLDSKTTPVVAKSFWSYVFAAFGAGLLLVFTPCVLPMVPILSGLIVGSGDKPVSRSRAGAMSIAYVLGTAITYTLMGVLAGAAGVQLQAYFQHPIAISAMVVILILLALSMFGAFNLAMPSGAQSRLSQWGGKLKSGSLLLTLVMGLLSALIVSACVSPLLIAALGVAIQKGDPVLGGAMMFAMALGMGTLLIAFGFGASWLIPKAGAWMDRVKELFGFSVLAVAIIVASSLKEAPVLILWSALLIGFALWLWQIAKEREATMLALLLNVFAILSLFWSAAAFVGGLTGGQQIMSPLSEWSVASVNRTTDSTVAKAEVEFNKVSTVAEIESLLAAAKVAKQPILVDYYADWCTDCKRMDFSTYREAEVVKALDDWQLIKVDVTKVNADTQAAKKFFAVFGPPATLFFDQDGVEKEQLRRYGYIKKDDMLLLAESAVSNH